MGGRLQIGMAEIRSESLADFIPESVADLLRNQQTCEFVQDCERIDWRYDQATIAIRRDLEAKIAAADRATVAQAGPWR